MVRTVRPEVGQHDLAHTKLYSTTSWKLKHAVSTEVKMWTKRTKLYLDSEVQLLVLEFLLSDFEHALFETSLPRHKL